MKNVNIIKQVEEDARNFAKTISGDANALKTANADLYNAFNSVLQTAKKDKNQIIGVTSKSKNLEVPIRNVNDLLYALRTPNAMKPEVVALLNQGLLKSKFTPINLLDDIARDVVGSQNFINRYSVMDDVAMTKELKLRNYSDNAVNSLMNAAKKNPKFRKARKNPAGGQGGQTGGGTGKNKTTIPSKWWDEIKKRASTMKWPQLLKWATGIGLTGGALWYFLKDNNIQNEGAPTIPPLEGTYPTCINDLIKTGEAQIKRTPGGIQMINVVNSDYPKGLNFFTNGRVGDVATGKRGSYVCKGNAPSLTESKKLSLLNILIEEINTIDEVTQAVDDTQLQNDVEKMIDYLDFPVRTQNLIDAHTLLTKYVNNGKVKDFLDLYNESGLMTGDLGTTLSYIKTFDADSVMAKRKLQNLYNQILNGSATTTSTTTTGEKIGLKNINITWDSSSGQSSNDGGGQGGGQSSGSRPIPPELVDAQGVMAFQNWLDRKTVRWHKKYGKLYGDKSKGYGIYGPNTSKAWEDYGYMYMKELENANRTSQNDALSTNDITPDVMRKSSADYQAATGSRPGFGSISTAQQRADIERIKRERGL